jgi:GNAT superfamily N-acetyltransferase
LHIRPAARVDATDVANTACKAYGLPPVLGPWFEALVGRPGWQVYVGEADDRVVATGSVYIRGDQAWLGIGATLPEYRRRGAQRALLTERIRFAIAANCKLLATETGEAIAAEPNPSLDNIRRCGFIKICSRLNFAARY